MCLGAIFNIEKDLPGEWTKQKEQKQGTTIHHNKFNVDEDLPKEWTNRKEELNKQSQRSKSRHSKHVDVTQLEHGSNKVQHEATKYLAPKTLPTVVERNRSTIPNHDHIINKDKLDTHLKTHHRLVSPGQEQNGHVHGEKGP